MSDSSRAAEVQLDVGRPAREQVPLAGGEEGEEGPAVEVPDLLVQLGCLCRVFVLQFQEADVGSAAGAGVPAHDPANDAVRADVAAVFSGEGLDDSHGGVHAVVFVWRVYVDRWRR